jgi:hypothetical protein
VPDTKGAGKDFIADISLALSCARIDSLGIVQGWGGKVIAAVRGPVRCPGESDGLRRCSADREDYLGNQTASMDKTRPEASSKSFPGRRPGEDTIEFDSCFSDEE